MDEYLDRIKEWVDQLSTVGTFVDEEDLVLYIIKSLFTLPIQRIPWRPLLLLMIWMILSYPSMARSWWRKPYDALDLKKFP